jgi:protein TonB
VDRAARPRWPIRPAYPDSARRRGQESTVVVEAWIDEIGEVAFSSVLRSGGNDFDESARRAVAHSAFHPARLAGRDVASRLALRIHFELYE